MELIAVPQPAFPRLAWIAHLDAARRRCVVEHGPFVAVDPGSRPRWVAACIWDGPFAAGRFHRSGAVFGSGVRVDGDEIHFVPASTTIERLFYVRDGHRLTVSNSLIVLLARLGASLDARADHVRWAEGCCLGIYDYNRDVPVSHPGHEAVRQVIFTSLVLRDGVESFVHRQKPARFAGYRDYLERMLSRLRALAANAADPQRGRAARLVSTASRGYDSPAVTCLATRLGAPIVSYSAARSNTHIPAVAARFMDADVVDDDGSEIARALGATPRHLDADLRALPGDLETWMWASGLISPELIFWRLFADAEASDALTVWLAGHFGDGAWDTRPSPRVAQGTLYRAAPSGYALAEARIRSGVLDCSVPFLFGTSAAEIHRISLSDEMAPWRLGNDYDRPICRRLLEEHGIAREAFGFGKKAVAQDFDAPQGDQLRRAFFDSTHWSSLSAALYRGTNLTAFLAARARVFLEARGARDRMLQTSTRVPRAVLREITPWVDLRKATFLHCVGAACEAVASAAPAAAAGEVRAAG